VKPGRRAAASQRTPSAGSRRQGREAALQALYLAELSRQSAADLSPAVWSQEPLADKTQRFASHLIEGVSSSRPRIDPVLVKYAENWELSRMATVDRCILRLAAFELLSDLDTPVSVIINEAVEIARKYSTAESSKFVNGILDKVKLDRKSLF